MIHKIKQLFVLAFAVAPVMVYAHPGHHHEASFWTGFMHPFTGLDHLLMVLALGVLMWTANKQWKLLGVMGLLIALLIGFNLGARMYVPVNIAEYGIIASLFISALALWTRSKALLPLAVMSLAIFHGVAHGVELASNGQVFQQVSGMLVAMAVIYGLGLVLGRLIAQYIPFGKKILGTIAAVVALIGLA